MLRFRWTAVIATLALIPVASISDSGDRFASETAQVTISGTSTLHDWTVKGTVITGAITVTPALPENPRDLANSRVMVNVDIPVSSLKSEHRAMDEVMYKALKATENPMIRFALTDLRPEGGDTRAFRVAAAGDLTVAGKTRRIRMTADARRISSEAFTISLSTTMRMTDFAIRPPTAMLGVIQSGDTITVAISWTVKK